MLGKQAPGGRSVISHGQSVHPNWLGALLLPVGRSVMMGRRNAVVVFVLFA